MNIVADSSAFLAVVMGEPERREIVRAVRGVDLIAPDVLPYELGNALTSMLKRQLIGSDDVLNVWDALQKIPVELKPSEIKESLGLAVTYGMYAYDAYFLQCAKRHRCPLITLDRRMRDVAVESNIQVVEVKGK